MSFDYDVVIIGSGFGGSVSALRLTEKGYKVAVLEAGRRFEDHEFAKNSFNLRKFLWMPALGCYGIQRIDFLKNALIMSGAGVGGGSLVYANTLYEPPDVFYRDPSWQHITDWKSELAPFYDQAKRMLGVTIYPYDSPADRVMRETAKRMGVEGTFHYAPVGVTFSETMGESVGDPYFGGVGPERKSCTNCGECMSGCRHNAKNTLVKNYLYLAEKAGAVVHPLTTVKEVVPLPGGGYEVRTKKTNRRFSSVKSITAEQVIFAARTMGTQRLLHDLKHRKVLPNISDRLGVTTRTNSEAIMGAMSANLKVDYTEGVAITSSFHPNEFTHIEPCRYGKGSNSLSVLVTVPARDGSGKAPWVVWLKNLFKYNIKLRYFYDMFHWSERTVVALVMQTHDNSITTYLKPRRFGRKPKLTSKQGHGQPNPAYIEEGYEVSKHMADIMEGNFGTTVGEPFGMPMTAHFMGGCAIGDSPENSVVDPYHRIWGYKGLHIMDGSNVTANLGVNPSLTITALTERATSLWPNRGDADPRPEMYEPYKRISPVAPNAPVVPDGAPAAYVLPLSPA